MKVTNENFLDVATSRFKCPPNAHVCAVSPAQLTRGEWGMRDVTWCTITERRNWASGKTGVARELERESYRITKCNCSDIRKIYTVFSLNLVIALACCIRHNILAIFHMHRVYLYLAFFMCCIYGAYNIHKYILGIYSSMIIIMQFSFAQKRTKSQKLGNAGYKTLHIARRSTGIANSWSLTVRSTSGHEKIFFIQTHSHKLRSAL